MTHALPKSAGAMLPTILQEAGKLVSCSIAKYAQLQ